MIDDIGRIEDRPLIERAYLFAKNAHGDQKRKYTGEPYIVHPVEVARTLYTVTDCPFTLCAALLHDVVEDTEITIEEVVSEFGMVIGRLVSDVTDVSTVYDGNRTARKEIDHLWLSGASEKGQTIKLADLISNSKSIIDHDPKFAKTYMMEKKLLLEVLTLGNETLYDQCQQIVNDYEKGNK